MVEWRIGAISEEWRLDWFGDRDTPFGVRGEPQVQIVDSSMGFGAAKRCLGDERGIDWGSCAWRGTRDDFMRLAKELRETDPSVFDFMREGELYALVFIELY